MPHEELLKEFEILATSAAGLNPFLQRVSQRLHEN